MFEVYNVVVHNGDADDMTTSRSSGCRIAAAAKAFIRGCSSESFKAEEEGHRNGKNGMIATMIKMLLKSKPTKPRAGMSASHGSAWVCARRNGARS